ncbi:MAG: NAD-dependent epimerase/dehydratase family protein [Planctomycetes bacterium]|nr:NAD-dependent epimerase/dehydratase family protein [Planctomycetota bacterium]
MNLKSKTRTALVGAGFIADAHLRALRELRSEVEVVAVVDVDAQRARRFAEAQKIARHYGSAEELLAAGEVDAVHVMVPPELHARAATPFLAAGVHVLLEKPLALSVAEAEGLLAAAQRGGARLAVNHNATFYPPFRRLLDDLAARRLGAVRHVQSIVNLPLRQLSAGDFAHWMFRHPKNILFEQGPHPLSQIVRLLGRALEVETLRSGKRELLPGLDFYTSWQLAIRCERGTAQLYFGPGGAMPTNRLVALGEDAIAECDFLADGYALREKTHSEFFEGALQSASAAKQWKRAARAMRTGYMLSTLKLRPSCDPFAAGMRGSIASFHQALRAGHEPECSGASGRDVVSLCELATQDLPAPTFRPTKPAELPPRAAEVLVLGASGFIGRHLVRRLRRAGHPLRVLVRKPGMLPEHLRDPEIRVLAGDLADPRALREAVAGVRCVVHLATGMGNTWQEMQERMIAGAENVARACLENGKPRLLFASTIAVYDLTGSSPVTEQTPLDPHPEKRSLYARAKIACEQLLQRLAAEQGLELAILRPGVVIGEGGMPNHSGVGLWLHDTRVIGWGQGKTPLPLVLGSDVAEALALAVEARELTLRSMNLVGDLRLGAREYCSELSRALQRDVRYQPCALWRWQADEILRWLVKKAIRRPNATFPSWTDLATRALRSPFDCSETKSALGWQPERDRQRFVAQAFDVHASRATASESSSLALSS